MTWEMLAWYSMPHGEYVPYPPMWRSTRAVALAELWEATVDLLGGVPVMRRAYWVPPRRRGAHPHWGVCRERTHTQGLALDIEPCAGMSLEDMAHRLCAAARQRTVPWSGVVRLPDHVHVDIKPRGGLYLVPRGNPRDVIRYRYPPPPRGALLYRVA